MTEIPRPYQVRRFLYPLDKEPRLDHDGLLAGDDEQFRRIMGLRSIEDVQSMSRVLVLAEAGMGKTVLMQALKEGLPPGSACLLELGEFRGDGTSLVSAVERHLESASDPVILLDGLDEAADHAALLARKIREWSANCKIWISSRDIPAIHRLTEGKGGASSGGQPEELSCFLLAPLSEKDISELACAKGIDGDRFLDDVRRHQLFPLCSTPLACNLVLSIYAEKGGLEAASQSQVFAKGVRLLCDETRVGRTPHFPLDQVVDCAGWISIFLILTGRRHVWTGPDSKVAADSISLSQFRTDEYSLDLLRYVVQLGVFRKGGTETAVFAHARYQDYLAACGFAKFIGQQHWDTLLLREDRRGLLPERAGVAGFLAELVDTPFRQVLLQVAPEALLASDDLVQSVGAGVLCHKLFERAAEMSYRQRHSTSVRSNLWRLKGRDATDLVCRVLADPNAGEAEYDLAVLIATTCACEEASRHLIDRALNKDLALQDRVRAASAAADIGNQAENARLKALLPLDQAEDADDDLRGAVLQCLWPEHLTVEELTEHLVFPNRKTYSYHYKEFLRITLPATFHEHINEDNARNLLAWAVRLFDAGNEDYIFRRLIGQIFVLCWRWASFPQYTPLFAEGFRASVRTCSPLFHIEEEMAHDGTGAVMTRNAFLADDTRRLDVLMEVCRGFEEPLSLGWVLEGSFPLLWEGDMDALLECALGEEEPRVLARIGECIRAILFNVDVGEHRDKIQKVHEHSGGVIPNSDELEAMQESTQKGEEYRRRQREIAAERQESRQQREEREINEEIMRRVYSESGPADLFCQVAYLLFRSTSIVIPDHINIAQCDRGKQLNEEAWERIENIAETFLTKNSASNLFIKNKHWVVQALLLLHQRGRSIEFSEDVWRLLIMPTLMVVMGTTRGESSSFLNPIMKRYPAIVEDGLVQALLQEENPEYCKQMVRNWKSQLTDNQSEQFLDTVMGPDCDPERGYAILRGLLDCGQIARVSECLNGLLQDKFQPYPDVQWAKHLLLALETSPATYARKILDALDADPFWGRSWIETVVDADEKGVGRHFIECGSDCVATLLIWLRREYPPEKAPQHDGFHFVQTLDRVYMLQNGLISHLVESGQEGAAAALERVSCEFPNERWVSNAVLDARAKEQSKRSGFLSPEQIKKLRGSGPSLVQNVRDIHDLVLRKLGEYQDHLQTETRAVNDLWETHKPRPKGEEDVSDHLKRYLDLVLPSGAVVNREVQIRRKLFPEGEPGARTDVWVQALDSESKEPLTLCIEVKCNWNQEGKNALRAQLLEKYMMPRGAGAGILLLCWFDCPKWDSSDSRKNKRSPVWPDMETARLALEAQAETERQKGSLISAVVIDCSLA